MYYSVLTLHNDVKSILHMRELGFKGLKYLAQGHPAQKYPYCALNLEVFCPKVLSHTSTPEMTNWRGWGYENQKQIFLRNVAIPLCLVWVHNSNHLGHFTHSRQAGEISINAHFPEENKWEEEPAWVHVSNQDISLVRGRFWLLWTSQKGRRRLGASREDTACMLSCFSHVWNSLRSRGP